jgi:hypothetical protein
VLEELEAAAAGDYVVVVVVVVDLLYAEYLHLYSSNNPYL